MLKIRKKGNYQQYAGKPIVQSSKTQPNMAMSIPEILVRFAGGRPITGNAANPYYDENSTGVDISTLDLVEREQFIEAQRKRLYDLQQKMKADKIEHERIKQENRAKETAEWQKRMDDAIEAKIRERNNQP